MCRGQHSLNMGPTCGPGDLQNREKKSIKTRIISWTMFLIDFLMFFGCLLGGCLVDFKCQVEGQIRLIVKILRKHKKK